MHYMNQYVKYAGKYGFPSFHLESPHAHTRYTLSHWYGVLCTYVKNMRQYSKKQKQNIYPPYFASFFKYLEFASQNELVAAGRPDLRESN
jgi:hypothetical protein